MNEPEKLKEVEQNLSKEYLIESVEYWKQAYDKLLTGKNKRPFTPELLGFKEYESNKDYWNPSWFKNKPMKTPDGKDFEVLHKWEIRKLINYDNRYLIKCYRDEQSEVDKLYFVQVRINSHSDGIIILKALEVI